MLDNRIETILNKYFSKSASITEMIELTEWLDIPSNKAIFVDFVKANYLTDIAMLNFDTEKEKEKILIAIKEREKRIKSNKIKQFYKYAAVFVVCICIGFLYVKKDNFIDENEVGTQPLVESQILPGSDKAVLTLEDGTNLVLDKGKQMLLNGRTVTGEKLVYDAKPKVKAKVPQYNYLTIPRGGQYFVQLSDGTNVWLNSDTKLKYPVSFIKEESRSVELIYGEAYFDVSHSTNHNGANFIVKTGLQEVEVLGTEFNIKAYTDEDHIVTTLVKGKVNVDNGNQVKSLMPSEQSQINVKNNNEIVVKQVDKLFDEIAWKQGYFSFKKKTMKEIMKTLSRWYDVNYVFEDEALKDKSFTGVLDRETAIEDILVYIQKTNEVNFEIDDKKVIIK